MLRKQTGKSRAQRISLDYYKQPDQFQRLRRLLTLATLAATGIYAILIVLGNFTGPAVESGVQEHGATSLLTGWSRGQASTGPLAKVHAAFESECYRCHRSGLETPLASDAWRGSREPEIVMAIAQTCTTSECHQVGRHFDHDTVLVTAQVHEQDCVRCHRDHMGREARLAEVSNQECTTCHADTSSVVSSKVATTRPVSEFALPSKQSIGHPRFRSLENDASRQSDAGEVFFDHAQHLQPGQVDTTEAGGFRLEHVSDRWREKYRADSNGLIQLQCDDCHAFEEGRAGVVPMRQARYSTPIKFEQHCVACHQLNYAGLSLPHAEPDIDLYIAAKLTGALRVDLIGTSSDEARLRPRPDLGIGESPDEGALPIETVDRARQQIERLCSKCHQEQHYSREFIAAAAKGATAPLLPSRWLRAAKFSHAAHGKMDCQFCHQDATDPSWRGGDPRPRDHERIMIGNIETCVPCHRPSDMATPLDLLPDSRQLNSQPTWASNDCVYCHSYHGLHGDVTGTQTP